MVWVHFPAVLFYIVAVHMLSNSHHYLLCMRVYNPVLGVDKKLGGLITGTTQFGTSPRWVEEKLGAHSEHSKDKRGHNKSIVRHAQGCVAQISNNRVFSWIL